MMIGSDSSARSTDGLTCKGKPHPRGLELFQDSSQVCRDQRQMSMGKAIHTNDYAPAGPLVSKQGLHKGGYMADLVIFDDQEIKDRATFEETVSKTEEYIMSL